MLKTPYTPQVVQSIAKALAGVRRPDRSSMPTLSDVEDLPFASTSDSGLGARHGRSGNSPCGEATPDAAHAARVDAIGSARVQFLLVEIVGKQVGDSQVVQIGKRKMVFP